MYEILKFGQIELILSDEAFNMNYMVEQWIGEMWDMEE